MKRVTLKGARSNANLSRRELGRKMGVCEKTVYNWETGKSMIGKAKFIAFCSITGFSPSDIILPIEYLK